MSPPLSVSTDFASPGQPGGFFWDNGLLRHSFALPVHTESVRVLIVDDHPDAAESLAIVLSSEGYDVQTSCDGGEAFEAIERWRPRVALLDLDLPTLGGLELARRARELPFGAEMFLAALTGYGRESDRQSSHDAGFDAHLVKPVDPAALLQLLEQAEVAPTA